MFFEVLEQRRLLSIALDSHGLLTVLGSSSADSIKVSQSSSTLKVYLNGVTSNFNVSQVKKLALYGQGGNDKIALDSNIKIPAILDGGANDDSLTGGSGPDSLYGQAGNDTLVAGSSGKDCLFGGDGNDSLVAGPGSDTTSGGNGTDMLDYSHVSGHLNLKIGYGPISGAPGDHAWIYSDIENIIGNGSAGCIVGTAGPNIIYTGNGNTTVVPGGGNDVIYAGNGSNTYMFMPSVSSKASTTTISAGPSVQNTVVSAAVTPVNPSILDFSLLTKTSPVTVHLNQDVMAMYDNITVKDLSPGQFIHFQTVLGGAGNDSIFGNDANDSLAGNGGDDKLTPGNGKATLDGGAGNDTMFGTGTGADNFIGGPGSNTVDYSSRTDNLVLKADNLPDSGAPGEGDTIHSDITTIMGSQGDDSIVGAAGKADLLVGGTASVMALVISGVVVPGNTLVGSTGDDTLIAGNNGDFIVGNGGNDFIIGGSGADVIFAGDSSGNPAATGVASGNATIFGGDGDDSIVGGLGDDDIDGQGDNDTIHGGAGNDTVSGESGEDWLFGDAGNDNIAGGDDGDSIGGGPGNDIVDGGDGDDMIDDSLADPVTGLVAVATPTQTSKALVQPADDTTNDDGDTIPDPNPPDTGPSDPGPGDSVDGGTGNDTIIGGAQDDTLNGGDGSDSIDGNGGADIINGQDGDNTMNGGDGDDTMSGGIGDNHFFGDDGNDVLLNANGLADSVDGGDGTNIAQDDPSGTDTITNADIQDPNPADSGVGGAAEESFFLPFENIFSDDAQIVQQAPDTQQISPLSVTALVSPLVNVGNVAHIQDGILVIDHISDTINDKIVITQDAGGVHVTENGGTVETFAASGINVIAVNTGSGNDYVSMNNVSIPGALFGFTGNDTLIGGNGNDSLKGYDGLDLLQGMNGNDSLEGDLGNDSLFGGSGDDYLNGGMTGSFYSGSDGADSMDGGAGNDYVDYRYRTDNLTIRLDGTARSGAAGETDKVLNNIENALGGSGSDLMVGNAQANYLSGGAGNDTIFGNGGTDAIVGGAGVDSTFSGAAYSFTYISGDGTADGYSLGNSGTGFVQKDTAPADFTVAKQNPPA